MVVFLVLSLGFGLAFASDLLSVMLQVTLAGHPFGSITAATYSPNGRLIATGGTDGNIHLIDITNDKKVQSFFGHSDAVKQITFSADGKIIASMCSSGILILWDTSNGKERRRLMYPYGISVFALSKDGKQLVTGGYDRIIRLWDVKNGTIQRSLKGHLSDIASVDFSPDRRTVISGSSDHTVRFWDVITGKEKKRITHPKNAFSRALFNPQGNIVATASENDVRLWDTATGSELRRLPIAATRFARISFNPDGSRLGVSAEDGLVVWDVTLNKLVSRVFSGFVGTQSFHPDGRRIAITGMGELKIWDTIRAAELPDMRSKHLRGVSSLVFSPDSRTIVTAQGNLQIWDVKSGKPIQQIQSNSDTLDRALFTPDGLNLLTVTSEIDVTLRNIKSGKETLRFRGHSGIIYDIAVSSNGKNLATASFDQTVRIWDVATATTKRTLKHNSSVQSVSFSPDGKIISTVSESTVSIWDTASGKLIKQLKPFTVDLIFCVSFSPDGRKLAVGGMTGLFIFDTTTFEELQKIELFKGWVTALAFSPDGGFVVTGSTDKIARIIDVNTGQEKIKLNGNTGDILDVAFSPDGTRVATGSIDTARIYCAKDCLPVFDSLGYLIISAPDDSRVTINDQTAFSSQRLPAGTYKVVVSKDGFTSFTQTVTVMNQQTTKVNARLVAETGTLSISSDTPNARLYINGEDKGALNISGTTFILPSGTFLLEVRAVGFVVESRLVAIEADRTTTLLFSLEKEFGVIVIFTNTPNAIVTVNSIEYQNIPITGLEVRVPIGEIEIEIKALGYVTRQIKVQVTANEPVSVNINLSPK